MQKPSRTRQTVYTDLNWLSYRTTGFYSRGDEADTTLLPYTFCDAAHSFGKLIKTIYKIYIHEASVNRQCAFRVQTG